MPPNEDNMPLSVGTELIQKTPSTFSSTSSRSSSGVDSATIDVSRESAKSLQQENVEQEKGSALDENEEQKENNNNINNNKENELAPSIIKDEPTESDDNGKEENENEQQVDDEKTSIVVSQPENTEEYENESEVQDNAIITDEKVNCESNDDDVQEETNICQVQANEEDENEKALQQTAYNFEEITDEEENGTGTSHDKEDQVEKPSITSNDDAVTDVKTPIVEQATPEKHDDDNSGTDNIPNNESKVTDQVTKKQEECEEEGGTDEEDVVEETNASKSLHSTRFGQAFQSFGNRIKNRKLLLSKSSGSAGILKSQSNQSNVTTTTTQDASQKQVSRKKKKEVDYESFRAGSISVTIHKESTDTPLGIMLKVRESGIGDDVDNDIEQTSDRVYDFEEEKKEDIEYEESQETDQVIQISEVFKDGDNVGLLSNAPINVGDVIKSINNQKCTNLEETRKLLIESQGTITLFIETPRGNPSLVQVMVTKPTKDAMVGIGFFNIFRRHATSLLEINHISPDGLLSQSLLNQGYLVLAINGTPCSHLKALEAAELIKQVSRLDLVINCTAA